MSQLYKGARARAMGAAKSAGKTVTDRKLPFLMNGCLLFMTMTSFVSMTSFVAVLLPAKTNEWYQTKCIVSIPPSAQAPINCTILA